MHTATQRANTIKSHFSLWRINNTPTHAKSSAHRWTDRSDFDRIGQQRSYASPIRCEVTNISAHELYMLDTFTFTLKKTAIAISIVQVVLRWSIQSMALLSHAWDSAHIEWFCILCCVRFDPGRRLTKQTERQWISNGIKCNSKLQLNAS